MTRYLQILAWRAVSLFSLLAPSIWRPWRTGDAWWHLLLRGPELSTWDRILNINSYDYYDELWMWDVSGRFRPRLRLQQINRIMFQRKSLTSEEFSMGSNKCRSPRHSRAACWLSSAWNLWGWRRPPCSATPGRARRRGGSTRRDRPRCPPRTGVDQPSSRTWGRQEPTWGRWVWNSWSREWRNSKKDKISNYQTETWKMSIRNIKKIIVQINRQCITKEK